MNSIEKLLQSLLGEQESQSHKFAHDPTNQLYFDVNNAFVHTLCDLLHGVREIEMAFPHREEGKEKIETMCRVQPAIYKEESRNGDVVKFALPRTFTYYDPRSRVLQHRGRRANPFFHLYEAMWVLAGQNDVTKLTPFVKQAAEYSDDGKTWHGAYGHRWRYHFGGDQLAHVIKSLKEDGFPNRRLVLQMWDPRADLIGFEYNSGKSLSYEDTNADFTYGVEYSKDIPCNTHCYIQPRKAKQDDGTHKIYLDLTVMNRSNDMFWGMLGSNYVTFSFLLEYIAGMTGYETGVYTQFTANAHFYLDKFPVETLEEWHKEDTDHFVLPPADERVPLVSSPENFDEEVLRFVEAPLSTKRYKNDFFNLVAVPMMHAHNFLKTGDLKAALRQCDFIGQADWAKAAKDFIATSKLAKQSVSHVLN